MKLYLLMQKSFVTGESQVMAVFDDESGAKEICRLMQIGSDHFLLTEGNASN